MIVNDVHSRLNATRADRLVTVDSLTALCRAITGARGSHLTVAGGRHAMGGQQFGSGATALDTRPMARVLGFDRRQGHIEVEAGIQWPELVDYLLAVQQDRVTQWGIAQKQTGANFFTVGGSVSANCHGRGLTMAPIVRDVESLRLVRADGSVVVCSRTQNPELFRLVVGGYGLFGAVYSVTLRLARRRKLERVVEMITVQQLVGAVTERISAGFLYGDFQFAIDPDSPDFLTTGVFSCYRPVPDSTPIPEDQRALTPEDWQALLLLAHTDKSRAFDVYARHYLATSGQLYWSDLQQLAVYLDDYHHDLDRLLDAEQTGTEMISELYVPRDRLADFMAAAADELRHSEADLIYGTVRFIERDEESWLAWADDSYACAVFNLHTPHTEEGVARSAAAFRRLIDLAIQRGGSYYLTYHRWADHEQVSACYPQFAEFLALKRHYDPDELFDSDWYRHYAALFPAVDGTSTPLRPHRVDQGGDSRIAS